METGFTDSGEMLAFIMAQTYAGCIVKVVWDSHRACWWCIVS